MIDTVRLSQKEIADRALSAYQSGDVGKADQLVRALLRVEPSNVDALNILGFIRRDRNDLPGALSAFTAAIKSGPAHAWSYLNRATTLAALMRHNDAIQDFRKSIAISPVIEAWMGLGIEYLAIEEFAKAKESFQHVLILDPTSGEALNNLATALRKMELLEEAASTLITASKRLPNSWEVLYNHAMTLSQLNRPKEANEYYDRVLALNPGHNKSKHYKAMNLLALGEFEEGWRLFEERWQTVFKPNDWLDTPHARWCAGAKNARLYLWSEQGLGDELFFSQWLDSANKLGEVIAVGVDWRLIKLLSRSFPKYKFIDKRYPPDANEYNSHLPLASLPLSLSQQGLDWYRLRRMPFLKPDSTYVNTLREKLTSPNKTLCGISWKSFRNDLGPGKTIPIENLIPVFETSNLVFVNLQYGEIDDDLAKLRQALGKDPFVPTGIDNQHDLDGHTALVAACDLLLLASNATAHIAGTMGKDAFMLTPAGKSLMWYWYQSCENTHSKWYPSIRLLRRRHKDKWSAAIQKFQH